jgi:hypothetical protein
MKKRLLLTLVPTVLLAAGCSREVDFSQTRDRLEYAPVTVRIAAEEDSPDTRSLIPTEAERFRNAALFAFGNDGRILAYRDIEGGKNVAIEVTRKSFDWILPMNTDLEIYALVNYNSLADLGLSLSNPNLTRSDLDNLTFTCPTVSAFSSLEASKLPMTGTVRKTITNYGDGLEITVKRLFARYDILFDASSFTEKGYTLKSGYMEARNCNTAVPYFGNGFKVDARHGSLAASMDRLTDAQLLALFDKSLPDYDASHPEKDRTATLYFLENCQGDIGKASSWEQVYYELGETAMRYATYVEVYLTAAKDGKSEDFRYRIYLGKTDQKSNFDVQRNLSKQLTLTLRPILPETAGERPGAAPFDGFKFVYEKDLLQHSGRYVDIPFETNLPQDAIQVAWADDNYLEIPADQAFVTEYKSNTTHHTRYAYSGTIRLYAPEKSTNDLDKYVSVTGGVLNDPASRDETEVHVRHTKWITVDLTHEWGQDEYVFTATEPMPCRLDMRVYIGTSVSPAYMSLNTGESTISYDMPPEDDRTVRYMDIYKLDGKTPPPYIYTSPNTEYHFILSIEGDNIESQTEV